VQNAPKIFLNRKAGQKRKLKTDMTTYLKELQAEH